MKRLLRHHPVPLLLAFVCFGGALLSAITNVEAWPFTPYGMYAYTMRQPNFTWWKLYGVRPNGTEVPFVKAEWILPFDLAETTWSLQKILTMRDENRLKAAVGDILARYEARRLLRQVDGEFFLGIRFYAERWQIDLAQDTLQPPAARQLLLDVPLKTALQWRK